MIHVHARGATLPAQLHARCASADSADGSCKRGRRTGCILFWITFTVVGFDDALASGDHTKVLRAHRRTRNLLVERAGRDSEFGPAVRGVLVALGRQGDVPSSASTMP